MLENKQKIFLGFVFSAFGCGQGQNLSLPASESSEMSLTQEVNSPVESLIPADRLSEIKAVLPQVENIKLQKILNSTDTLWYDAEVMTPSYQDSLGASSNNHWPDLVAAPESIIGGLHDRTN